MSTLPICQAYAPDFALDGNAVRRVLRGTAAAATAIAQVAAVAAVLYGFAAGPGLLDDCASTVSSISMR